MVWPEHGSVGDICFIENHRVFYDKSQILVESFARDLGMDIHRGVAESECTLYNELAIVVPSELLQNRYPFKFCSFSGLAYPQGPCRFFTYEQQQVSAGSIETVLVYLWGNVLPFDEYGPPDSLAFAQIVLVERVALGVPFDADDDLFHDRHNTARMGLGQVSVFGSGQGLVSAIVL